MLKQSLDSSNLSFAFFDPIGQQHNVNVTDVCMQVEINKFPRLTLSYSSDGVIPVQGTEIFFQISLDSNHDFSLHPTLSSRWFLISSTHNLVDNKIVASFSCHLGAFSRLTAFALNNDSVGSIVKSFFDSSYVFDVSDSLPVLDTFVSYYDSLEILFARVAKYTNSFFIFIPFLPDESNSMISTWKIIWKKDILSLKSAYQPESFERSFFYTPPASLTCDSLQDGIHSFDISTPLYLNQFLIEPEISNIIFPPEFSDSLFTNTSSTFSQFIPATIHHNKRSSSDYHNLFVDTDDHNLSLNFHVIHSQLADFSYLRHVFDFSIFLNFQRYHPHLSQSQPYFPVGFIFSFSSSLADSDSFRSSINLRQFSLPLNHLTIPEHTFRRLMSRLNSFKEYQSFLNSFHLLFDHESQLPQDPNSIKYPICHAVTHDHWSPDSLGAIRLDDKGFYKTRIAVKIIGVNNLVEVDWAIPLAAFNSVDSGIGGGDFILVPEKGTLGYILFLGDDGSPVFFLNSHFPPNSSVVKAADDNIVHCLKTIHGLSIISDQGCVNIGANHRLHLRAKRIVETE